MPLALPAGLDWTIPATVMALYKTYRLPPETRFLQMPLTPRQVQTINRERGPVVLAPASDSNYWLLLGDAASQ